jgi:hypothetical protein
MNSALVSLLAFSAIFGGALTGVWVARQLPQPHLSRKTRNAISLSMAVVGTLAALVVSLMISNASTSFNTRKDAVENLAVDIVKLNRALFRYGPATAKARETLQIYARAKAHELSNPTGETGLGLDTLRILETINDQILALHPADDRERHIQARALQVVDAITDARWLLVEKADLAIPPPFLMLLIFWLSLLFSSFGLFAPRNATVIVALLLCALAISGGIMMILELGAPSSGLIRVSVTAIDKAITEIAPDGQ